MEESIKELLISFLGEYSKQCGEWYSFNCPCCAEENLGQPDDKYNLEIKIDIGVKGCGGFHCWKCGDTNGMKGTLVHLFKLYAPRKTYSEFKRIVKEYRDSMSYLLPNDGDFNSDIGDVEYLMLPDGFKPINKDDIHCQKAYDYLLGRGLTDKIITDYNIGYISNGSNDYSLRYRVYIPSYDAFDNLTYWVGRDYTGNNKQKVKNPKRSKTEIVFNEGKINWYEPITLVEGPFDHIVTPNSIPLMGKTLAIDNVVAKTLMKKCKYGVNIFLDDDALDSAYRIYSILDDGGLKGKVKIIETPDGYDPSLIFQEFGYKGIIKALNSAKRPEEFDVLQRNKFGKYPKK